MKKILKLAAVFAAAAVAFALSSCSKDNMSEKRIVGKWRCLNATEQSYRDGQIVYDDSENYGNYDWYWGYIFNSDGTGNEMYVHESGTTEMYPISWVVLENKLVITYTDDGDTDSFEIDHLKGNSMILSYREEYFWEGANYKDIVTYTFKKM